MNKECSEYSVDDSEKKEDSINSNEMLLNDNDEYQAGDVSIQMLRTEKASPHELKYSLFHFDNEDVNKETSESLGTKSLEFGTFAPPSGEVRQTENHEIRKQKKVKRRILVSVGLLAVVMIAMVTTSVVTLPHAALLETRNVTSNRISSFLEPPFMLENTSLPELYELVIKYRINAELGDADAQYRLGLMHKSGREVLLNKDLHLRNIAWALCIETDLVCHNQTEKLLNGTENQRNKDMHVRNTTWDTYTKMDKVCLNRTGKVYLSQMKKLSNGIEKQQNKDMHVLNLIWDLCTGMGKVHLNLTKKL
uniref:Uncharacterized protein n=1 Tax=Plectus sambesii TaxID=2011161 RepID=A0A914X6X2_9BILA